jgi:hypothetical protein
MPIADPSNTPNKITGAPLTSSQPDVVRPRNKSFESVRRELAELRQTNSLGCSAVNRDTGKKADKAGKEAQELWRSSMSSDFVTHTPRRSTMIQLYKEVETARAQDKAAQEKVAKEVEPGAWLKEVKQTIAKMASLAQPASTAPSKRASMAVSSNRPSAPDTTKRRSLPNPLPASRPASSPAVSQPASTVPPSKRASMALSSISPSMAQEIAKRRQSLPTSLTAAQTPIPRRQLSQIRRSKSQ